MVAHAGTSARSAGGTPPGAATGGGFRGAVGAEWIKLWTIRSTWACLLSGIVLQIGYSVIVGLSEGSQQGAAAVAERMTAPETAVGGTLYMAQFAVVTLAALAIASEYATGSIRSTLLCVPLRGRMLAAKTVVVSCVLFVSGVLLALLGTVTAMMTMGGSARSPSVADVLSHALAIGGYLALAAVLVLGLGTIMRSVAGTLTAMGVIMLVVPVGLILSKVKVLTAVADFLPGPAGLHLMYGSTGPDGRGVALLVLASWAALVQVGGYLVLRTRDA